MLRHRYVHADSKINYVKPMLDSCFEGICVLLSVLVLPASLYSAIDLLSLLLPNDWEESAAFITLLHFLPRHKELSRHEPFCTDKGRAPFTSASTCASLCAWKARAEHICRLPRDKMMEIPYTAQGTIFLQKCKCGCNFHQEQAQKQ